MVRCPIYIIDRPWNYCSLFIQCLLLNLSWLEHWPWFGPFFSGNCLFRVHSKHFFKQGFFNESGTVYVILPLCIVNLLSISRKDILVKANIRHGKRLRWFRINNRYFQYWKIKYCEKLHKLNIWVTGHFESTYSAGHGWLCDENGWLVELPNQVDQLNTKPHFFLYTANISFLPKTYNILATPTVMHSYALYSVLQVRMQHLQ